MPRYGAKTYGRPGGGPGLRASSAFDNIMQQDHAARPSTAKTAATTTKWGKTSFTSTRGSPIFTEQRKRKAGNSTALDDPFSFDSDDEGMGSSHQSEASEPMDETASVVQENHATSRSWTDALKPVGNINIQKHFKVKVSKTAVRTYSRPVKASIGSSHNVQTVSIKPKLLSTVQYSAKPHTNTRMAPKPRKFFLSSSPPDHTYSQPLQDSDNESVQSMGNASNTDSKSSRVFDIDSDFDIRSDEELESGDPEIIFNSPKKRALEAQKRQALGSDEESEKTSTTRSDSPHSIDSSDDRDGSGRFSGLRTYSSTNNNNGKMTDSHAEYNKSRRLLLSKKLSMDSRQEKKSAGKPLVRRLLTSPKKARSTYNPRQWHADSEGVTEPSSQESSNSTQPKKVAKPNPFDADFDEEPVKEKPVLRRTVTWPSRPGDEAVSTVRVNKEHKKLFTVVRNVKEAHECQESGEAQEFDDDIVYIMDGLYDKQNQSMRCLSCLSLLSKGMMPGFRMHLRAHGTITEILSALHDSPRLPNLALCTSAILYMLSRDRLNLDLERQGLELMLELLNVDTQHTTHRQSDKEYERIRAKIRNTFQTSKMDRHTRHLDLDEITTGNLAMETLLSLTSRRAGDLFKEELRNLGGLDHIVNAMGECIEDLSEFEIEPSEGTLQRIQKVERCLRVIENVTYLNSENQNYLITFNSSLLITSIASVLRLCENVLPFNAVEVDGEGQPNKESKGFLLFSCLLAILRVLLNLTHDNKVGSSVVGQQNNLIKTVLTCILQIPQYVPSSQQFDLQVLSFGLMINMVEHCDGNRQQLIETEVSSSYDAADSGSEETTAIEAMIQLLTLRLEAAKKSEQEQEAEKKRRKQERIQREEEAAERNNVDPDETGEWHESESGLEWVTFKRNRDTPPIVNNGQDDEDNDSDDDLNVMASQEEDTFTEALHRAGKHMEDSIVAAYISLLIGCIVENNSDLVEQVRECLPDGNFEPMVIMLKKFLGFMNFTSGEAGAKSIRRVIQTLDAC